MNTRDISNHFTQGALGKRNFHVTALKQFELYCQMLERWIEFNAIAEPSVKMIVANQEENKRLIEIRDTLLPKLMSGAIDVSKVDLTQLTNNHLADC